MEIAFAPDEIVALLQPAWVRGATQETVRGIASLEIAHPGDLSFLSNKKYAAEVGRTRASVVLLPQAFAGEPAAGQMFVGVANPSAALGRVCGPVERALWPRPAPGIHPSAVVATDAKVSASATIGPLCVVEAGAVVGERTHLQAQVFIGRAARIGSDCWLMPGSCVTTECVLGDRVRLQPGAVVGSDGFGYELLQGRHEKQPQIGNVVVENDVEIGAATAIDRARFSSTLIGEGTKIDNLVQVAHNVRVGKHCLICSQTGISGSCVLEDYVVLAGQVGLAGHLTLGKGTQVAAQSGVSKDWPAGSVIRGHPAQPIMDEQRVMALRNRLPELFRRVSALEGAETARPPAPRS